MVRLATGAKETPEVASSRAYLRNGLPAMYQDGDFGMRFVGALETVLDPIVAVCRALPAPFNPHPAPRALLGPPPSGPASPRGKPSACSPRGWASSSRRESRCATAASASDGSPSSGP